jgi:signal transduction histidine kinase
VLCRYKLEGYDTDWHSAVGMRLASYTNLPPRQYRFRVAGRNDDGVWNEAGAMLQFDIAPMFYQTNWFLLLGGLATVFLLWRLYHWRLRFVTARLDLQHAERLSKRERIARELHDTLLQSFHGVMFRFQAARNMLPRRTEEAIEALDEAIERTADAIAEGRDAIHDLRSSTVVTSELAQAVTALGAEMSNEPSSQDSAQGSANFHVVVEGAPRDLHPILRDEVYAIACEAVRNAFRHAQASNIEANIRYNRNSFQLRIRDDGNGIDSEIVAEGRAGHYGVSGMRERAKRIGGKLAVWTRTGAGTEIELSIPGSIAYGTSPGLTALGLFRWHGLLAFCSKLSGTFRRRDSSRRAPAGI